MAKGLIFVAKNPNKKRSKAFYEKICKKMEPDNLKAAAPYVYEDGLTTACIFNPSESSKKDKASFCLGSPMVRNYQGDIFKIGAPLPDGSLALFRNDDRYVEVFTDYAASRTIWYLQTDDFFVVSSSQRLMAASIGSLEPNERATAWSLAAGILGPGVAWDKRFQYLTQNCSVLFDKQAWQVRITRGEPLSIRPRPQEFDSARDELQRQVKRANDELDIQGDQWTIALSGGMDSRSLIYHLKDRKGINAVTWSTESSHGDKRSDAHLAEEIAKASGVDHFFARMNETVEVFPKMFERFIAAGEGRVDHLSGYMDGLQLWAQLGEQGRGIVRGYDAFGRKPPVTSEYQARLASGLLLTNENLRIDVPIEFQVNEADLPASLLRQPNEELETWRDRLWLQFRTPHVTAALDEIKVSYVEICNPLLSRCVVKLAQELPVELRDNKSLFRSIVQAMYPTIPFAKKASVQPIDLVLNIEGARDYFHDQLMTGDLPYPRELRDEIVRNIESGSKKNVAFRKAVLLAKRFLPMSLENQLRRNIARSKISNRRLALRALISKQTLELLKSDADYGAQLLKDQEISRTSAA